jgi:hypothetical protein
LNKQFPSLTHLHIVDSFGIDENEKWNLKFSRIYSLNASDIKISNLFNNLLESMPNLTNLQINSNILLNCNRIILSKNRIKYLELITNNFDQINDLLLYFPTLEQLIINSKKQFNQSERKFYRIILHWFEICSRLYTIHIKAHKLADLFYSIRIEINQTMHIQYSNEVLTIWK